MPESKYNPSLFSEVPVSEQARLDTQVAQSKPKFPNRRPPSKKTQNTQSNPIQPTASDYPNPVDDSGCKLM